MTGCDACEFGWRSVQMPYCEKMFPVADDDDDEAIERARERRAAAMNTVYPCKVCQPNLFFRWVGGHLDKEHDRGACEECSSIGHRRRGARHVSAPVNAGYTEPERKDVF